MEQVINDIVRQARQADLVQWLRMNGEQLKQAGRWWYLMNHDSLRIQGNKWYHNSQGIGGNSIDFLVYYFQMPTKQAIIELTKPVYKPELKKEICGVKEKNKKTSVFDFSSIKTDSDYRRVLAYLIKNRGISDNVVMAEINNKRLYQEKETANAIFVILNEVDSIVGAEMNGTLSFKKARFKGVKSGSSSAYGYNVGQQNKPHYILFFESAIDLLSFISLSKNQLKLLSECLLVSMGGLKLNVVKMSLHAFGNPKSIPVFCADNDRAAYNFIDGCLKDYPNALVRKPDHTFKDWNDQLCNVPFTM